MCGRVYCPCVYSYFYGGGGVNCVFLCVVLVVASLRMCCVAVKQVLSWQVYHLSIRVLFVSVD